MGGKTSTTTQQVQIPQDVLNRYNAVNARAEQAATTPFQQYSTDPNAFVAPLTSTQQAGIAGTNAAANQAQPYFDAATGQLMYAQNSTQPYYSAATGNIGQAQNIGSALGGLSLGTLAGASAQANPLQGQAAQNINAGLAGAQPYQGAATGLALAGAQAVNADPITGQSIAQYLSPYLSTVLGSTSALLNQNNQQAMSGQLGNAINNGAFGGDRAGIVAANLNQQQNLAAGNIYSNILQSGFEQALGAAQQQQGVNLGASQANRAALAGAAGQLQGIGQQGYEQSLGAAGAQAALGNQVYTQGANTAAQQAALGQQQFGQGMTAAQQQAALGQAIYGQGANTAQALAGLGTGAQGAALQGAQAQLAAGQAQQQTEQAGKTALYNQFLQQQSYPFQVAQFLANIAEGTGSLSGSTTTTTQPGGFFSDERLKEGIKPIGKSFDGQDIVRYRYKGDPRERIGLIAQDVEKKHPDAVGEAMGFKTVDYGKATDDAADRGHFYRGGLAAGGPMRGGYAEGGSPYLPGLSGADMGALLAAQAQMFGPFSAGGIYGSGGVGGGAVRGGSSYVPQANLPVSHLTVAAPPPQQPTALQQTKDVVDLANAGSKLIPHRHSASPLASSSNDNDLDTDIFGGEEAFYRGGLVRRYANGGIAPYQDDVSDGMPGLNIPQDEPKNLHLAVAPPLQKGDSGGGGLGGVFGFVKHFLPFKDGGLADSRYGYAPGGSPDDDPNIAAIDSAPDDGGGSIWGFDKPAWPQIAKVGSTIGHALTTPVIETNAPGKLGMFGVADDAAAPPTGSTTTLDANGIPVARAPISAPTVGTPLGNYKVPVPAGGEAGDAPVHHLHRARGLGAAAPAATGIEVQPTNPAVSSGPTDLPMATPTSVAGLSNIIPPTGKLTQPRPDQGDQGAPDQPGATGGGGGGAGGAHDILARIAPKGGYISRLTHGDPQTLIPFLAAIGAMGTAPTVHPGVALAAGLSAGANSYLNTKQQLANVGQTQAQTGLIGQEAESAGATAAHTRIVNMADLAAMAKSGYVVQEDPAGNFVTPDGKHWKVVMSNNLTGMTSAAQIGPHKYLSDAATSFAPQARSDYMLATPADQNASRQQQSLIANDANDARANSSRLNQYATSISFNDKGLLQPGPFNPVKQALVNQWNDTVRTLGLPGNLQIDPQGATEAAIADKMATVNAQLQASGQGQHSLGAFETNMHAVANQTMPREAALEIVGQNYIDNQRRIDLANYMREFGSATGAPDRSSFLTREAMDSFGSDFSQDRYNRERRYLELGLKNGAFARVNEALQSRDPRVRAQTIQQLEAVSPGFSRYFTGGQ